MREYESKPREYWETVSLPLNFERVFEGKVVQVEIEVFNSTPEYDEIAIFVDAGWRSFFYPFGKTIVVRKNKKSGEITE